MSAAFLRCVCNAVQDNDVQAALQRMLALESQLRETDSPQLSVPVFPPGNGSSGVWPSRILASTSFVRWLVRWFVSTVVDSDRVDRVDRVDGGDPSVRLDRSANPSHSHSHRLHRLHRVDHLERWEGCENGDGRERSGVVEGWDGVGVWSAGRNAARTRNEQRPIDERR